MGFRLTPRDTSFFDILTEASQYLVTGADLLNELACSGYEGKTKIGEQLHHVENEADKCTHKMVKKINSTFVTPLDRDDLYLLSSTMDDCMDYMDEAGDLIVLYKVGRLPKRGREMVKILQQCAKLTSQAMPRLESMDSLSDYWVEINRLENEADRAYRRAIADLFDNEDDAKMIIKMKDIIISLEKGVDAFEKLANTLETIVVKES